MDDIDRRSSSWSLVFVGEGLGGLIEEGVHSVCLISSLVSAAVKCSKAAICGRIVAECFEIDFVYVVRQHYASGSR